MTVSKCLKLTLPLVALFCTLYFSPGCTKKTYVTYISKDTTIIVDSNLDKQIQLYFFAGQGVQTTTPTIVAGRTYKFNKHNYVGVDSIVFMTNPNTAGDTSNYSIVSLYDITDSVPIAGSTLSNNVHNPNIFVQTGNIYKSLPDKEITLGVTIRSKNDVTGSNQVAQVSDAYLFLFRK